MQDEFDGAAAASAGMIYWDFSRGGDYSMMDANGVDRGTALSALVRPYPELVAGTPSSISFDSTSSTFLFQYAPDKTISAPTELMIPASSYPNGYKVNCTGCTYQQTGATLLISANAGANAVTVQVTP